MVGPPGGWFARNVAKQTFGEPDIGVGGVAGGRITLPPPSDVVPDSTGAGEVLGKGDSSGAGKVTRKRRVLEIALAVMGTVTMLLFSAF